MLSLGRVFYNACWVLLADGVVDFFYILLIFCLVVLSITDGGVLQSQLHLWNCLFPLLILSVFASYALRLCGLVHLHSGLLCFIGGLILLSLCDVPLCLW